MVYVYEDYPQENAQRRDNIDGKLIEDMTYAEWKRKKSAQQSEDEVFKYGIYSRNVRVKDVGETKPAENYSEVIQNRFISASETARRIYKRYIPDGGAVEDANWSGRAHHEKGKIYMNYEKDAQNPRGIGTTWFHEHGHYLDYMLGNISQNDVFMDMIKDDVRKIELDIAKEMKPKTKSEMRYMVGDYFYNLGNQTNGIQDILGGVIGKRYPGTIWGHDKEQWKDMGKYGVCKETFAHMFDAMYSEEKAKYMAEYMPKSWNFFQTLMEGAIQ